MRFMVRVIAVSASVSVVPGGRLNEIVIAGKWP